MNELIGLWKDEWVLVTGKWIENDGKTFKGKDSGSESPMKGPVEERMNGNGWDRYKYSMGEWGMWKRTKK